MILLNGNNEYKVKIMHLQGQKRYMSQSILSYIYIYIHVYLKKKKKEGCGKVTKSQSWTEGIDLFIQRPFDLLNALHQISSVSLFLEF